LARHRHLPPVVHVVLLVEAGGAVVATTRGGASDLQLFRSVGLDNGEVPELGLEGPPGQSEAEAEDAVGEEAVVVQTEAVGAVVPEAALHFTQLRLLEVELALAESAAEETTGSRPLGLDVDALGHDVERQAVAVDEDVVVVVVLCSQLALEGA